MKVAAVLVTLAGVALAELLDCGDARYDPTQVCSCSTSPSREARRGGRDDAAGTPL